MRDDVRRMKDRTFGDRQPDEERKFDHYLAVMRAKTNHNRPEVIWRLRDVIRHTAKTLLPSLGPWPPTPEALIDRARGWKLPSGAGELPRGLAEREVAYAIYRGAEGTADMVCDAAWRRCFQDGEELCERMLTVPDEELAQVFYGDVSEAEQDAALARYGVTVELLEHAIGLAMLDVPEEVEDFWVGEYLEPLWMSPKGFNISRLGAQLPH